MSEQQSLIEARPLTLRLALIRSGFGLRDDKGIRAMVREFIREERAERRAA